MRLPSNFSARKWHVTDSIRHARLVAAAGCLMACASATTSRESNPGAASAAVTGATLTVADIRTLRWIEGTWRGTGGGESPFVERYRFVDDSTLLVDDPTATTPQPPTTFALRNGRFGTMGEVRWEAAQVVEGAVMFAPVRRARNFFVWRPASKDEWIAELAWLPPPDTTRRAQLPRRYVMRRWSPGS